MSKRDIISSVHKRGRAVGHANRSKQSRANNRCANPTAAQIKALREEFGLSQREFGEVMCSTLKAVQAWEYGERNMHPVTWEAYLVFFGKAEPRRYQPSA